MDSRQQFEEKYPLPEGMFFDESQGSYAGTKDFWLWCTRWESWQASRESMVVEMPYDVMHVTNISYEDGRDDVIAAIHATGIRTK